MSEITLLNIDILKTSRSALLRGLDDIPRDKWTLIPPGYKTNLLWNVGHLVVSQQILNYLFSGVQMHINNDIFAWFRKGTDPAAWEGSVEIEPLLEDFTRLPDLLKEDYSNGIFRRYRKYTTELGTVIANIDEAIAFNTFHEGIHAGIIGALKKQLS